MRELILRLGSTPDEVSQARLLKSEALRYEEVAQRLIRSTSETDSDDQSKAQSTSSLSTEIGTWSSRSSDALRHSSLRRFRAKPSTDDDAPLEMANGSLAKALGLDEAGQYAAAYTTYTEAAEYFLKVLRMSKQLHKHEMRTMIKSRLERTLERAEQLKPFQTSSCSSSSSSSSSSCSAEEKRPDIKWKDSSNATSDGISRW
mmetsp:Transcript_20887/g.48511  ORF Transcript_20887/g.48511 Transcript_20887/m.48511 type:complete len:202 (+) Transcript_20887:246-851(+)